MKIRFSKDDLPKVSTVLKPIDRSKAKLEAEKGEVAINANATVIHKILGKPHSKGGTPLDLEDNSFIFSKDSSLAIDKRTQERFGLTVPLSKKLKDNTPSKILLRNIDIEHNNQMAAILDNESLYDNISKNTAELMISKNQEILGKIAYLQEAKKKFENGLPEFSKNTQPIYNSEVKDKINTSLQYAKKGGRFSSSCDCLKKYGPGGLTTDGCPANFYKNSKGECVPVAFDAQLRLKSPYDISKKEGKGYTDIQRKPFSDDYRNSYNNAYNETLSLDLTNDATLAWQKAVYAKDKPVIDYYYNNKFMAFNNASVSNPEKTFTDHYFRKDGLMYVNKNFNSDQELNDEIIKMGLKESPSGVKGEYVYDKRTDGVIPTKFTLNIKTDKPAVPVVSGLPIEPPSNTALDPLKVVKKDFQDPIYANHKSPLSTGQIIDLTSAATLLAARKDYFPKLYNNSYTSVELEKLNPNQALQENANNWLQSSRIAATMGNGPQYNAFLQKAAIEGTAGSSKIREGYESKNVEIANNQNQNNNTGFNNVRATNVGNRRTYDTLVDTTLGRINEERINGAALLTNKLLGHLSLNKKFDNIINRKEQFNQVDKNGNILRVNGRPLKNFAYSTDVDGNITRNNVSGEDYYGGPSSLADKNETEMMSNLMTLSKDLSLTAKERLDAMKTYSSILRTNGLQKMKLKKDTEDTEGNVKKYGGYTYKRK